MFHMGGVAAIGPASIKKINFTRSIPLYNAPEIKSKAFQQIYGLVSNGMMREANRPDAG